MIQQAQSPLPIWLHGTNNEHFHGIVLYFEITICRYGNGEKSCHECQNFRGRSCESQEDLLSKDILLLISRGKLYLCVIFPFKQQKQKHIRNFITISIIMVKFLHLVLVASLVPSAFSYFGWRVMCWAHFCSGND